jgi:hypothetical protein
VNEGNRAQYLLKEGLDDFDRKTSILILFYKLIKGGAQRLENKAEMTCMIKRVLVAHDTLFIFLISFINVFEYFFFYVR